MLNVASGTLGGVRAVWFRIVVIECHFGARGKIHVVVVVGNISNMRIAPSHINVVVFHDDDVLDIIYVASHVGIRVTKGCDAVLAYYSK